MPSDQQLSTKHVLGIKYLTAADVELILDTAREYKGVINRPIKKVPSLRDTTVANLFFENSTRTRISFELAEKRLSADTVNFSAASSSVKKGIDASIVNAGDGTHEHPTQALLDAYSMRDAVGGNLRGKKVCIFGDITHSRVALSNIFCLQKLGAKVRVCGPPTLIPKHITSLGAEVSYNVDDSLAWCDVANVLRIQLERQDTKFIPSLREYNRQFGITRARVDRLDKPVVIMHPGPMNRGVEIDTSVADSEHSIILDQVENGVAVRMAVLYLLAARRKEE